MNSHYAILMMNDKVDQVISNIKEPEKTKVSKTETKRKSLIGYFQCNRQRMLYKTFLERGFLIGSGAIESAHRHVLQQRLKLSGQR